MRYSKKTQTIKFFTGTLPNIFLSLALVAVTLAVFAEVVLRYFTDVAFYGIEEVITIFIAYFYFLAIVYVTQHKKHITVDLLDMVIKSKKVLRYLDLLPSLLGLVVCIAYSYMSYQHCYWTFAGNQITVNIGYPRVFLVAAVLIAFSLMTVYFILDIVNALKAFRRSESENKETP